jgi:hypothetical protein
MHSGMMQCDQFSAQSMPGISIFYEVSTQLLYQDLQLCGMFRRIQFQERCNPELCLYSIFVWNLESSRVDDFSDVSHGLLLRTGLSESWSFLRAPTPTVTYREQTKRHKQRQPMV